MIVELSDFVFPAQSSQTGLFSSLPSLVVLTCSLVYRFPEPVPELVWGGCCWVSVQARTRELLDSLPPPPEPWTLCPFTLHIFCTVLTVNKLLKFFLVKLESAPKSGPSALTIILHRPESGCIN